MYIHNSTVISRNLDKVVASFSIPSKLVIHSARRRLFTGVICVNNALLEEVSYVFPKQFV